MLVNWMTRRRCDAHTSSGACVDVMVVMMWLSCFIVQSLTAKAKRLSDREAELSSREAALHRSEATVDEVWLGEGGVVP